METVLLTTIVGALLLDLLFGEPRKFHPLVGFGKLTNIIEKQLNPSHKQSSELTIIVGALSVMILIIPFALLLLLLIKILNHMGFDIARTCAPGVKTVLSWRFKRFTAAISNDCQP